MENAIHNIAVISFPRTCSKTLTKFLAEKYNKIPAYGVLHKPEYLGKNEYNIREVVFGQNHILHGHWHSLDKLDLDVYDCIKENYTIVSSHRDRRLVYQSLAKIIGQTDINSVFERLLLETEAEKYKWDISEYYAIEGDEIYTIQQPDPKSILV